MNDRMQNQPGFTQHSLRTRIDTISDAFEEQWIVGNEPGIEDFLKDSLDVERSSLFEELLDVELEYRRKNGEQPTPEDYHARFPEFPEVISAASWKTKTTSSCKKLAYGIWLLFVVWVVGGCVLGLLVEHGGLDRGMAGALGMLWGIGLGMPLILFGLPASIILFIIGVAADRRTRRK